MSREIVHATPNSDLEALPDLDFEEFFEQHKRALPRSVLRDLGDLRLSYETSRGCWWGQKHHCTFCGLNGNGMGYREKSADRVISELMHLVETTGISKIDMTDNIMPFAYFNTLIPKLANLNLPVEIFYEQKANISLDKVLALKAAGINRIQPGIEAISDPLLKLMRKGTSTKQNIALLRYARSIGMMIDWNLLSGFPNDREEWYAQTLELSRVCLHLPPPTILTKVNFDRFSPYFENPVQFGITNLTPHYNYAGAFPEAEQLEDLAYHFTGDCSRITVDNSAVLRDLRAHIAYWRQIWDDASADKPAPCLEVIEVGPDSYLLIDTRPLPQAVFMRQISTDQARVALLFHSQSSDAVRWGVEQAVCFPSGDGYIPLACASPSVLQRFESLKAPDLADVAV
ncbi:MAG TPA: RiPP maturation radical SAM C-methyltransferase [Magnetospirillaceae bacterium]|nr:RiPP maturation radical SAM C-methyltransferase [Magnetospirillaceae bacterium]